MDMSVAVDLQNETRPMGHRAPKVVASGVNVWYGEKHALKDVSIAIPERSVMAFIGPSGCGKSTFLRCINIASLECALSDMWNSTIQ